MSEHPHSPPPAPAPRSRATFPLAATAAIFLLHTVGILLLFEHPADLFTGRPILEQDYGLHAFHLHSLAAFWQEGGRLWGYNPAFMAGFPSNTIQDLSIKFFEIAALFLPGVEPDLAFKLLVVAAAAAVPWLAYLALRTFLGKGADDRLAALAAFLATACWWNSYSREMFFIGMVGFTTLCFLTPLLLALLYRLVAEEHSPWRLRLAWAVVATIFLPLHQLGVVVAGLPAAILVAWAIIRRRWSGLLWAAAGLLPALAVNSPWLAVFLRHLGDNPPLGVADEVGVFLSADPWTFVKDYLGSSLYFTFRISLFEKGLRIALLVTSLAGLATLARGGRKAVAATLGGGVLSMFLLTYFGSLSSLFSWMQPLRFKVMLDAYLTLCAVPAVGSIIAAGRGARPGAYAAPGILGLGLVALAVNLVQTEASGFMRLRTTVPPRARLVAEWVAREAPAGGRLLFEESGDESGFVHEGIYLSAFLPRWTGRELIGGPANLYLDRHHVAHFCSGRLLNRDMAGFSDDELRAIFRVYNIGAVIAFHPDSVARLLAVPGLVTVARQEGPLTFMKARQPLGWLAEGEGHAVAGPNVIRCDHVQGDHVVLKYHWVEGLRATPPAAIEPVRLLADDPIPFIRVNRPPPQFTLSVGNQPHDEKSRSR
jgi:hypothetical protein